MTENSPPAPTNAIEARARIDSLVWLDEKGRAERAQCI